MQVSSIGQSYAQSNQNNNNLLEQQLIQDQIDQLKNSTAGTQAQMQLLQTKIEGLRTEELCNYYAVTDLTNIIGPAYSVDLSPKAKQLQHSQGVAALVMP